MALDEANKDDNIFDQGSFKIVVNKDEIKNIGNVQIDFQESRYGSGFTVRSATSSTC